MNFEVELPDTPGQLVKVATLLAEQRANVIQLDHDQFKHPATTPTRCLSASRSRPTAPSTSTASSRHSGKPDSSPSASTDSNTAGGKPRRSVLQYLPLAEVAQKRRWVVTDNHQLLNPPTALSLC